MISFVVPGTDNVIDIKKYRAFKETKKLFTNYKNRIFAMKPDEVQQERARLRQELIRYPNHTLTSVKVHIFENTIKDKL